MEIWEPKAGDHIIINMRNPATCLSCGRTVAAGSWAMEAADYVMATNNKGTEVVGRRFRFIESPCLCPIAYVTDTSPELTQHAEKEQQIHITFWQETLYDAEKLPFPTNLDLMKMYREWLALAKTCSLARIMNIISGFSEEPTP